MEKLENEKYLISKLDSGEELKFVVLSHNAYWSSLQALREYYKNLKFRLFGGSYYDLEMFKVMPNELGDYDYILFFSSLGYDENEILNLKKLANEISTNEDKRVTIGYSYTMESNKRHEDVMDEVLLCSIKNGQVYEDIQPCSSMYSWNIRDLAGVTLKFHELSNTMKNKNVKIKKS